MTTAPTQVERQFRQLMVCDSTHAIVMELVTERQALASFKKLFNSMVESMWIAGTDDYTIYWGSPFLKRLPMEASDDFHVVPFVTTLVHSYKICPTCCDLQAKLVRSGKPDLMPERPCRHKKQSVEISTDLTAWTISCGDRLALSSLVPSEEIAKKYLPNTE